MFPELRYPKGPQSQRHTGESAIHIMSPGWVRMGDKSCWGWLSGRLTISRHKGYNGIETLRSRLQTSCGGNLGTVVF